MDLVKMKSGVAVNGRLLANLLAKHLVIQQGAVDDADNYDGGAVLDGVYLAAEEYSTSQTMALIAEVERLQSSLTLSREEGRREGMEEAAKMVDTECARVLATQTGKVDSFSMAVDQNVRMIALLMPDIAAAIRSEAKGERK